MLYIDLYETHPFFFIIFLTETAANARTMIVCVVFWLVTLAVYTSGTTRIDTNQTNTDGNQDDTKPSTVG